MAIQFVRAALESAHRHGLDVGAALREAGITPELVDRDATRVTREQANDVVQALWSATDDELAGFGPKPIPRGTFRMMTLGVIHSPDLREALSRLVEFCGIAVGLDSVEISDDAGQVCLTLTSAAHTPGDSFVAVVLSAVVHRFAGWLIGEQIPVTSMALPGPAPSYAADFLLIYGSAPVFDAPATTMTFASRYLDRPVIRTEAELFEFLRTAPNDLLFRDDYNPTTASRVRKILERAADGETVAAADVALRLHISPQHLRRLLREEGATFRDIKEEILRDEAIAALVAGRESVDQLAERLGFSEPSAFRRAFRRWTGSPPGAYRPAGERTP